MKDEKSSILSDAAIHITGLRCNYLENPIGVETSNPRLSWILHSNSNGQRQTAYRILAASNELLLDQDIGELWDSGRVYTDQSIQVAYGGLPPKSRQRCCWKVLVWDREEVACQWSDTAFWEMGLLDENDWQAQWICYSGTMAHEVDPRPAPMFRREIYLDRKVISARIYVSGLGYYELYINGEKSGSEVLAPAVSIYDKTVNYTTYDVTSAFVAGSNAICAMLGNGWYNCFTEDAWDFQHAPWRHHPKILLQIHLCFENGEEQVIASDTEWRTSTGPMLFDGLRNGEIYDARLEKDGWTRPGYDDSSWTKAVITRGSGGILRSQQMTPIKVTGTLIPVGLSEVKPGVWVYDFGQNISGWVQIRTEGPSGNRITLKYAEKIHEDGDIDQSNLSTLVKSGDFQTDQYIMKGEGTEVWEPRFTYHGFRYVQVAGFPGTPSLGSLTGKVVHTALESCGEFSCSNELLNKIQQCARWSTLTNFHGIPTDCPHREKNGWTGDAQLSAEQTLFNFDPMTAYIKWMVDFRDIQRPNGQLPGIIPTGGWGFNLCNGPAWDSAVILIPWYLYLYCGDMVILAEMYDNMKRYIRFMKAMATGDIVEFGLGDWCPPVGGPGGHKCPTAVTDTAYYYSDTVIVAIIANILGHMEDAAIFDELASRIRTSFRKKFLDCETGQVEGNSQTSMSCALYQGLVGMEEKEKVLSALVSELEKSNFHIDCGILGAKYVMHALTDLGRADLAYRIATQTTFPAWGHWIAQGATTLWETWAGDSSQNHHMFSDISAWFYKGLAGINPDPESPGFKHFVIRPNPAGDLTWVNARHKSMYGMIICNWRLEEGEFHLDVTIPVNSTATLQIPASDEYNGVHLESGHYSFKTKLNL